MSPALSACYCRCGIAAACIGSLGVAAFGAAGMFWPAVASYVLAFAALTLIVLRAMNARDLLDPAVSFFAIYLLLNAPGPVVQVAFGRQDAWLAATALWSLLAFLTGAELVRLVVGTERFSRLRRDFQTAPVTRPQGASWTRAAWLAGAAGMALGAGFYMRARGVPVTGGDVESARLAAAAGSGYLRQGILALLPVAALALGLSGIISRSRRAVWGAIALSAIAVALILGTGYLHPAVQLGVAWVVLIPAVGNRPVGLRRVAVALLGLFLIGSGYVWLRGASWPPRFADVAAGLAGSLARLAYASTDHLGKVIEAFPQPLPFLWGRGYVMDLAGLKPGPDLSFSHWLAARLDLARPEWADMSLMGEFYANFGWAGVGLGMFALGVIARVVYVRFLVGPKTVPRLLLLFVISFTIARASHGGLGANVVGYLIPNALAIAAIVGLSGLLSRLRPASARIADARRER